MGLNNANVLLGVTGGIAAYKAPDLVRKLKAKGANVRVVLSHSAKEFVSPLALQAVSGNPVSDSLLDPAAEAAMGHIELARWADVLLVAPATAHFIAKLALGMADDLLSTLCLATEAPIHIAPAMNQVMWSAQATQHNLEIVRQRNVVILGPDSGDQACGEVGPGRMLEPQELADILESADSAPVGLLQGKKVVITAGPTRENIDPVRYISNYSSGKMGYALAVAARDQGANVTLISGPVDLDCPNNVKRIDVVSARDMHSVTLEQMDDCDIFIACAAVADYRSAVDIEQKIKKDQASLSLNLVRNPDILAAVAALQDGPFTLGFAAETSNVEEYAKGKMQRKKLDMIAANDVSQPGLGFNSDDNALHVFWPEGDKVLPAASKLALSKELIQLVANIYQRHQR